MRKNVEDEHTKLKKHIEDTSGGIIGSIQRFFGGIGNWFHDRWVDVQNVFGGIGAWFHDKWSEAWGATTSVFGAIGQWFHDRWADIKNVFGAVGAWFHQKFSEAWGAVTGFFGFLGQWFGDRWSETKVKLAEIGWWFHQKFTEAWNATTGAFQFLGNWFNDRWTQVKTFLAPIGTWFRDKFQEARNFVTAVFSPIGNWFRDRWNETLVHVTNFKNSAIAKFNELKDGAANAFKGLVNSIVDQLNNGINAVERFINFIGQGLDNIATSQGTGSRTNEQHCIRDIQQGQGLGSWVDRQNFAKVRLRRGGGSAVNVPGNVQSWIAQAMALTHAPANWAGALATIAMHESGGNPAAINLTDSNARAGHPSQGLFQTIPSTFAAHALPGHGNILNPVDNAAAAIGYIVGRYGTVFNVPGIASMARGGPYVGYARGGFITEPILGMGLRTGTSYGFGEAGNEIVMPMAGFASPGGAFGGGSGNTEEE